VPINVGYEPDAGLAGYLAAYTGAGEAAQQGQQLGMQLDQQQAQARHQQQQIQLQQQEFQARQQPSQRDVWEQQGQLQQMGVHAQLQSQLQQTELTQQEEMRLQRARNDISQIDSLRVRNGGHLSDEEADNAIIQRQTGIDVLKQRQEAAMALRTQAQAAFQQQQLRRMTQNIPDAVYTETLPNGNTQHWVNNPRTGPQLEHIMNPNGDIVWSRTGRNADGSGGGAGGEQQQSHQATEFRAHLGDIEKHEKELRDHALRVWEATYTPDQRATHPFTYTGMTRGEMEELARNRAGQGRVNAGRPGESATPLPANMRPSAADTSGPEEYRVAVVHPDYSERTENEYRLHMSQLDAMARNTPATGAARTISGRGRQGVTIQSTTPERQNINNIRTAVLERRFLLRTYGNPQNMPEQERIRYETAVSQITSSGLFGRPGGTSGDWGAAR